MSSNLYWSLNYLEQQGGKLSTDGKTVTFGVQTIPCEIRKISGKAKIVISKNLMNTSNQVSQSKAEVDQAVQPCLNMYVSAEVIPPFLRPLFKDTAFINIGTKRYLKLRTRVHHTGIIVDQIF